MPSEPHERKTGAHGSDRGEAADDRLSGQLEALHQAIAGDGGSSLQDGSELAKLAAEVPGGKVLALIERVRAAERSKSKSVGETKQDPLGSTHRSTNSSFDAPLDGSDADPSEELPLSIGRFQILQQLGQGGFGLVLLAFDPQLDREIALKIPQFRTLATADSRARFLHEGRAAASLNHVNIAAVHEAGNIGAVSYIASAFCAGGSLADLLRNRQANGTGPLSVHSAAGLITALADAVQHAHSRGIVHRDLKPSNILFEYDPASDQPNGELARAARIVDFGLAKSLSADTDHTRSGAMLGTLGYMSPEQAAGDRDRVGPATDIYSLGAILYELLTGNPPLKKSSDLETMLAIQNDEPLAPRKVRADCPADLQAICLKCLEKSATDRYRSATELADDLRRFLAGESVTARPISGRERLTRWCRRNPIVATLSAAVVLLAVGASIASVALARSRSEVLRHLQAANSAKVDSMREALAANAAHAHSVRRTGTIGQRVESLRAISAAMENADDLGISADQRLQLRNEAIAGLSLVDLVIDQQWPAVTNEDSYPATSADCRLYVRVEGSELAVCDVQTNSVRHRLALDEPTDRYIGFMFSPDGKYFAARYEQAYSRERLHVWSLETGKSLGSMVAGGFGNGAGFSHDGQAIISAGRLNKKVEIYELPSLKQVRTLSLPGQPETLTGHPSEPYFACYVNPKRIEIRHAETGDLTRVLTVDSYAYALGWSPDGHYFASGSRDGTVAVYDGAVSEQPDPLKPIWKSDGHTVMAIHLGWHPDSTVLGTSSMDGVTRLWDADTGTSLVAADGLMTCFSRDGRWLGTNRGRWRIAGDDEHRIAAQPDFKTHRLLRFGVFNREDVTSQINHWEAYPRGRLLVGQNYSGCVIRDVTRDKPLAELQFDAGCLRFSPDGSYLIAYTISKGIHRLPVKIHEDVDHIDVSIGPPTKIMKQGPGFLAVGSDEMILFQPFFGQSVLIKQGQPPKATKLKPMHRSVMYGDIAPDGKFVATATFKGKDVQIHRTDNAELVHTLPAGAACPWFSRDNRILAVAEIGRYSFWEVGSWKLLNNLEVVTRGIWPGSMAFTSDSKVVAVEDGSTIRLLDTIHFEPLAEFQIPSGEIAESIRFTPDGRYLLAGGADENPTHIWDLHLIRARLGELELDWDYNVDAPANQLDPDKPIRLKLVFRGLAKFK
jgi:serine/threonine protein kinase/WD40 repeat protein